MKTVLPLISIATKPPGSPSLRLHAHAGGLDDRPPFVDLRLLERGQAFRRLLRARRDVEAQIRKPLPQRRIGQRFHGGGVEFGNDVLWRPPRRPESEPARHIKSGYT